MTKSQEYPINHFEQMKKLALALNQLPAQVEEHKYSYNSFGSWTTTIRFSGNQVRIIYDGKESEYSIQHSLDSGQNKWTNSVSIQSSNSSKSMPVEEIIEAIQKMGKLG